MPTASPAAPDPERAPRTPSARGGDGAEADEDPAGGVAHGGAAAAQDAADRPGGERVGAVAEQAEPDPAEPEHERLHPHGPVGVDELRQEGEEEEGGLRVQDVDHDALAEPPP